MVNVICAFARIIGYNQICTTFSLTAIWDKQFIPMTFDLASVDLDYHGEGYKNMLLTTIVHWKERYEFGILSYTDQTTLRYDIWRSIRL